MGDCGEYVPSSYCIDWTQFCAVKEWLLPMTEEIEGVVFLSERMVLNPELRLEAAQEFNKTSTLASREIIDSFNWVEADGFISGDIPEIEVTRYLGDLRCCWQWVIQARHPNHKILTKILLPEETGGWYGVGFQQSKCKN